MNGFSEKLLSDNDFKQAFVQQVLYLEDKEAKSLNKPVAICLSKVCEIYNQYQQAKNPETLFCEIEKKYDLEQSLYHFIKEKFSNHKFFAFSSIGVKAVGETWVPRVHGDADGDLVPDDDLQPLDIFEPLKWILRQI